MQCRREVRRLHAWLGKASAAVVVFFTLIVALTVAQWLAFRRRVHYTA